MHELLVSLETDAAVAAGICWHLQHWRHPGTTAPLTPPLPDQFRAVFVAQDELGWEAFLFGFWVQQWEAVQKAYLVSLNSKVPVKRWATSIILKLWDVAWDMWDQRNQFLHDKDFGLTVVALNQDIQSLFHAGEESVPLDERALFCTSLQDLLASPVTNRQLWVLRVKAAVARAARSRPEFYYERTIMRSWLQQSQSDRS